MNDILHYKGYYASIHFNAEENVFVGKVQKIEDLVLFEAGSFQELKAAFLAAIESYISNPPASGDQDTGHIE